MPEYTSNAKNKVSNYDIFKHDALVRFLTYDQKAVIRRLNLDVDDEYIYITFCSRKYRINRQVPGMDYLADGNDGIAGNDAVWKEADCNAVLTICDLLCHTTEPIRLSGTFTTLEGLNRVMAGTASNTLGEGFYGKTEKYFDENSRKLATACERIGGVAMGKGDVAYRIPIFDAISLQITFYESDDEFPAKLTFLLDSAVCDFLFYETIYYMIILILDQMKEIMERL